MPQRFPGMFGSGGTRAFLTLARSDDDRNAEILRDSRVREFSILGFTPHPGSTTDCCRQSCDVMAKEKAVFVVSSPLGHDTCRALACALCIICVCVYIYIYIYLCFSAVPPRNNPSNNSLSREKPRRAYLIPGDCIRSVFVGYARNYVALAHGECGPVLE
jgi:hypothetical protein